MLLRMTRSNNPLASDNAANPCRGLSFLRRVFAVDALRCPRCSCLMVVLSYLTDPRVVSKILTHLRLPTSSPRLTPATVHWQLDLFDEQDEQESQPHLAGQTRAHPSHRRSRPDAENSRAPPREARSWAD